MTNIIDKETELEELKKNSFTTRRVCSPQLEEILFEPLPILDHGFIRIIDYMGNDAAITQAARVSYGKGTKSVQNDKALINYLLRHSHTSPFEMCEIKFHIKAPIFVARQWVRHRTANINEYSGRYSLMSKEFYVPHSEDIKYQSLENKQGRDSVLPPEANQDVRKQLNKVGEQAFEVYHQLLHINPPEDLTTNNASNLESEDGLSRELARIVLPLSTYTEFYWKIDLNNLMHFLHLRSTPHAQYEIRVYAEKMLEILEKWLPLTYNAFINYKRQAIVLSKEGYRVISDLLHKDKINKKDYALTKREWIELETKFNLTNKFQ